MRLLLVEDELRMADAIAEILRQEHYDVDVCYNGSDGMDLIFCNIYDVIILDIMLPDLNGIEIVRQTRKEKIATPVLMLTAKSEVEDKVRGLDSGADDYLTKPFAVKELLARIRAMGRRNVSKMLLFTAILKYIHRTRKSKLFLYCHFVTVLFHVFQNSLHSKFVLIPASYMQA